MDRFAFLAEENGEPDLGSTLTYIMVDPSTVIAAIQAIVSAFNEFNAEQAERRYRDGVARALAAILSAVNQLRQELAEIGVRIIDQIQLTALAQADYQWIGAYSAYSDAYPTYPGDEERASRNFDTLNAATTTLAQHGEALTPHVVWGFLSLLVGSQHTSNGREATANFLRRYQSIFATYLDPNNSFSLVARKQILEDRIAEYERRVAVFAASGSVAIGVSGYGNIRHVETAIPPEDMETGWFSYRNEESQIEERRTRDPGEGPRGRALFSTHTMQTFDDPIAPSELIYYVNGPRIIQTPEEMAREHTGANLHGDVWIGHIRSHWATANLTLSYLRHLKRKIRAVDEWIQLSALVHDLTERQIAALDK